MPGRLLLLAIATSAFLGACGGGDAGGGTAARSLGADFGNAVRHNATAQVIDPSPADSGAPALDGGRAEAALRRYRADAVRELEVEHTTDRQTE